MEVKTKIEKSVKILRRFGWGFMIFGILFGLSGLSSLESETGAGGFFLIFIYIGLMYFLSGLMVKYHSKKISIALQENKLDLIERHYQSIIYFLSLFIFLTLPTGIFPLILGLLAIYIFNAKRRAISEINNL